LKIHEYQAKAILAKYGVPVPKGEMANTLEEANDVARTRFAEGAMGVVVKAQIHAGGRGKGGGVKVAKTRELADMHAKNILGMTLVTHQTGPQGQKVQRLLIEETAAIERELYLGIVLDRATGRLVFMASQAGGSHSHLQRDDRSDRGILAVAGAQTGFCAGTQSHADQPGGDVLPEPVHGLY
jgi:succinyl-CoA synthetase beta subunit